MDRFSSASIAPWQQSPKSNRPNSKNDSEDRWRRLNAIVRLAGALGLDPRVHDQDEAVVWQRWN